MPPVWNLPPLCRHGRVVALSGRRQLCGCRSGSYSARAAIEAHGGPRSHGHWPAVNRGDVTGAYIIHSRVIEKGATAPISAVITKSGISKTVYNTAVEAHFRTPVALVPKVGIAIRIKSPITRCPELAGERSKHPCARDPEITVRTQIGRASCRERV